jgi:plastocyanin
MQLDSSAMMPRLMRARMVAKVFLVTALALAAAATGPAQTAPGAGTPPPPPAELAGRIELKEKDGRLVPAAGVVVWVEGAPPAAAGAPTVTSRDKRFAPHVIAVSAGATVTFPNVDPIFHNVFSRTPGNEFDLGLYRRGAKRTIKLSKPGLVRVYCNIHPEMAAYVMVLSGAGHAVTGEEGTFVLRGIPPGRRVVHVWSERGGESEQTMVFRAGGRLRLDTTLDASAFRALRHKNKYGRDYPSVTRDVDRY